MRKEKKTIPVKKGEKLELVVENLASSGDGVCRYQGYTLFVPDCVIGDKVLVKICKITPFFGVCKTLKIVSPSPDRVEPFCPVFYKCGGCQLQYLQYDKQAEFKIQVVKDSIHRIGKIGLKKEPLFIPASQSMHYRNKGIFPVSKKQGKIKIGFYSRGTHDVVDVNNCPVMFDPINEIKEAVRFIIEKHSPSIYNEINHKGFLRNLIVRGSIKNKEYLIGLVTTAGNFDSKMVKEMADINKAAKGNYKVVGIVQNINTQKSNVVLGKKNKVLWGRGYFVYTMGKISYHLSLASFLQINPYQSERINCIVEEMLRPENGLIMDAYCGIGNMALWLSSLGRSVIGIEENEESVKNAIISAKENSIKNCSFIAATVEEYLTDTKNKKDFQVIILNPPRKGCSGEVIEALLKKRPGLIIYVSCNPATLARDLNKLCNEVYSIKDIRVIDMFPHTVHMETVVSLKNTLLASP